MLYIEQEIRQQPEVIERLLRAERDNAAHVAQAIREFDPTYVMIAARGTSDNAARYAQYLMAIQARLPVALATPSVHTLYRAHPKLDRALVIAISQSGQSDDVRQVVDDARAQGALTLSITNDPDSPIAQAAVHHIALRADKEVSVAATKTYTAQLSAIALLATSLTQDSEAQAALEHLPAHVAETIKMSAPIAEWAQRYRYMERLAVIGRGYNYSTAFEISLKIKELCYVTAQEYSEADFRHGPIAVVSRGFPVLSIAPSGQTQPLMLDLLARLKQLQAETLVISDTDEAIRQAQSPMRIPTGIPEWLSPVISVIPGQILAMHMALVKGHDVDKPEGLNKVTVTR